MSAPNHSPNVAERKACGSASVLGLAAAMASLKLGPGQIKGAIGASPVTGRGRGKASCGGAKKGRGKGSKKGRGHDHGDETTSANHELQNGDMTHDEDEPSNGRLWRESQEPVKKAQEAAQRKAQGQI